MYSQARQRMKIHCALPRNKLPLLYINITILDEQFVLEIEYDEYNLSEDKDAQCAFKTYEDIPISKIKKIYLEECDNSLQLRKLIAITFLYRDEHKTKYTNGIRFCGIPNNKLYYGYGIKDIKMIPLECMYNKTKLETLYLNLLYDVDHDSSFNEFTVEDCLAKFNIG